MKVRVAYTVEVSDYFRRAINEYFGRPGLASREEVREFLIQYGQTLDDDLIATEGGDDGR